MKPDRAISRHWYRRWLYAYCPPYRWWKHSKTHERYWRWRRARSHRRLLAAFKRYACALDEATRAMPVFAAALRRGRHG